MNPHCVGGVRISTALTAAATWVQSAALMNRQTASDKKLLGSEKIQVKQGRGTAVLPLLLDERFVVWRLLMFLPMALVLGAALRWRPRLLPWLCALHALADLSAGWIVVKVSRGNAPWG